MLPIIQFSQEFPHIKAFLGTLLEKKERDYVGKIPKRWRGSLLSPKNSAFPFKGKYKS